MVSKQLNDGDVFTGDLATTSNGLSDTVVEHEIEIIELQANAGTEPFDHDSLISDTYSDSDGYDNTVNTGNTDANFDSNKYERDNDTGVEQNHAVAFTNTDGARSVPEGVKILINNTAYKILAIGKDPLCTADEAYILDSGKNIIATTDNFVGNIAKFSQPIELVAASAYYLAVDKPSGTYNGRNEGAGSPAYPIAGTEFNYTTGFAANIDDATVLYNVTTAYAFTAQPSKLIEHDLPTITGSVVETQLIVRDSDRESGDEVNYQLEDGSANVDQDLELNTLNPITALVSNPTKMRIKLIPANTTNPVDGSPAVRTYALKLWKS